MSWCMNNGHQTWDNPWIGTRKERLLWIITKSKGHNNFFWCVYASQLHSVFTVLYFSKSVIAFKRKMNHLKIFCHFWSYWVVVNICFILCLISGICLLEYIFWWISLIFIHKERYLMPVDCYNVEVIMKI